MNTTIISDTQQTTTSTSSPFARAAIINGKRTERWNADTASLDRPLRWKAPRQIWLAGDLFAEGVSDEWIDRVFAVMALAPQHTFQVLTKRAARMRKYFSPETSYRTGDGSFSRGSVIAGLVGERDAGAPFHVWPLPNVWLGVSVEDQARADERIPLLLDTPAAVRFLSCEPLLGSISLRWLPIDYKPRQLRGEAIREYDAARGLGWIIAGGESGPGARPMHPDWARSLRDQCQAASVPFFLKQWGEWLAGENLGWPLARWQDGHEGEHPSPDRIEWRHFTTPGEYGAFAIRVGKRAAGRLLDGREWNEMPVAMPRRIQRSTC